MTATSHALTAYIKTPALCLLMLMAAIRADAQTEVVGTTPINLRILPAEDFLEEIRRPFRQDAWGEATGLVHYVSDTADRRGTLRVRVTFSAAAMHAQLVLNDVNVYAFEQRHHGDKPASLSVDMPEEEKPPGLFSFGIAPEDLTFAFVYWDFQRELPRETFRRRECRVMELANPQSDGAVRVWFSAKHGFPMKAEWYRNDQAETPWRTLELKGAKKHDDDLWFVKEMRLDGEGWKTKVRFDHAEINLLEERTAPIE